MITSVQLTFDNHFGLIIVFLNGISQYHVILEQFLRSVTINMAAFQKTEAKMAAYHYVHVWQEIMEADTCVYVY